MIQLSYNGELYSYDNKTATTVSSATSISVVIHPYVDIEGAKLFYSQEDTEGIVYITNNEAEIPGAYLVTGDLQVALKLASDEMSNTFTISVTKINSSGDVTDDDIQFTMDNKKRLILVPGSQSILAIQFDNQSEIVTFKFPRYQEEVDLSTKVPYVNYKRPQMEDLGKTLCTIEKTDDTFIYFSWMVDAAATQYSGTIQFQVEFADGEGYRWQSQIGELPILTSLYNTGLEPYTPSILEQYVQRLNQMIQSSLGVPAGGTTGQFLVKSSDDDFDTKWVAGNGQLGQVLTLLPKLGGGTIIGWGDAPAGAPVFNFTLDANDQVTSGPIWNDIDAALLSGTTAVVAHVTKNDGTELFAPLVFYDDTPGAWTAKFSAANGYDGLVYSIVSGTGIANTWVYNEWDINTDLTDLYDSKLDNNLGSSEAGKFLVVGSDGVITAVTMAEWQGGSY